MLGRSPRRKRARNESASRSTGSRSALESAIGLAPFEAPGQRRQDVLESHQGAGVTLARRRLVEAEDRRGLAVGELLVVPQGQDFAVDRVEAVQGLLEPDLAFGPDRRLAR